MNQRSNMIESARIELLFVTTELLLERLRPYFAAGKRGSHRSARGPHLFAPLSWRLSSSSTQQSLSARAQGKKIRVSR